MNWQEMFNEINETMFDNAIPSYTVKMRTMYSFGNCKYKKKIIVLSKNRENKVTLNTLIHEMTHAYLHSLGCKNRHSKRFWRTFTEKGGMITEINKKLYKKAELVAYEKNLKE